MIPSFMAALLPLNRRAYLRIEREYAAIFRALSEWNPDLSEFQEEAAELVNEVLPDLLNDSCPDYVHFSTHEGDGADFGFWASIESVEDAVKDGWIKQVSPEDDHKQAIRDHIAEEGEPPSHLFEVNERGNCVLFAVKRCGKGYRTEEVWSCV